MGDDASFWKTASAEKSPKTPQSFVVQNHPKFHNFRKQVINQSINGFGHVPNDLAGCGKVAEMGETQ